MAINFDAFSNKYISCSQETDSQERRFRRLDAEMSEFNFSFLTTEIQPDCGPAGWIEEKSTSIESKESRIQGEPNRIEPKATRTQRKPVWVGSNRVRSARVADRIGASATTLAEKANRCERHAIQCRPERLESGTDLAGSSGNRAGIAASASSPSLVPAVHVSALPSRRRPLSPFAFRLSPFYFSQCAVLQRSTVTVLTLLRSIMMNCWRSGIA
ncbi:MAG: hypothetical protein QOH88_3582 [Verrucomicrobiota bacterium]|jgi:hypothetical protein